MSLKISFSSAALIAAACFQTALATDFTSIPLITNMNNISRATLGSATGSVSKSSATITISPPETSTPVSVGVEYYCDNKQTIYIPLMKDSNNNWRANNFGIKCYNNATLFSIRALFKTKDGKNGAAVTESRPVEPIPTTNHVARIGKARDDKNKGFDCRKYSKWCDL